MPSILFVCTGNICRSPAAEGIARKLLPKEKKKKIDSAGTGAWHRGQPPDANMRAVAKERGFNIDDLRARQVSRQDFNDFDLIIGMDSEHIKALEYMKREYGGKAEVRKFLEQDVPDPYYGGIEGFYKVFDMIRDGVEKLFMVQTNETSVRFSDIGVR
ncbi:MAG: low molecular weight phosphotyrosine protein phosphatase [Fibromonadaceae bacterium]|jgi:protein-tyrosine phosphatase|nr:low molecular weight phosphotyrosine protein phosphatase [Fibromonadaceae bacterium]